MLTFQMLCQIGYILRRDVASHEADASDARPVFCHKVVQLPLVKNGTRILPEVFAVAAHALVGAVTDVDGQGHLIRNFLKDNIKIGVF